MRLMQRRSVDLPHPEGPMSAVMRFSATGSDTSCSARALPYQSESASISIAGCVGAAIAAGSPVAEVEVGSAAAMKRSRAFRPSLDCAGCIPASQVVAEPDRGEVHHGDD